MGCLQQDKVGPPHQVQGVKQCQVQGGETHLPPLLTGGPFIAKICVYHSSQVAELGGTLGLFVGFSFLGVFDALVSISCSAVNVFNRALLLSGNKSI